MTQLFAGLARFWREWRKRRRFARVIAAAVIRSRAEEVERLTDLVCRFTPVTAQEAQRLHTLRHEMRQLIVLTHKKEFACLSADRRLALHGSLVRTEDKLLLSLQTTHVPTQRMQ